MAIILIFAIIATDLLYNYYFFFSLAQSNPFEHLNLIEYACQELMVSFAVSNRAGISEFSPAISVIINEGNH